MRRKRLLSLVLTLCMVLGMIAVPAHADNTTTISGDGTANKTATMTITLVVPKKTPAASDFTYTAPADLAYSGSEKAATVTSSKNGMGTITVKYYSDASRSTEATPMNVNTYYVGITVAEGDQYVASTSVIYGDGWTFTITASTPDAPAAPTATSTTKNSVTLNAVSGCEYSKDGTNYQDGTTFSGLTPSTEYTFYQRLKATANTNASAASSAKVSTAADTYAMTITLVIGSPATVTTAPTAKTGLTANGSAQALVNAGVASGGTMQYALGTNATTAPTTGWSASIPTGTAAGTYYVWYKAVGDSGESSAACVTATISARQSSSSDSSSDSGSSGGGGGGGSSTSSTPGTTTETKTSETATAADGSAVTTELDASTTTTTNRDGSTTVTDKATETVKTENTDGSSVEVKTETVNAETTDSKKNADGSVTDTTKISNTETVTQTTTDQSGEKTITETKTEQDHSNAVTTKENADGSTTEKTETTETVKVTEQVKTESGTVLSETFTETTTETKTDMTTAVDGTATGTSTTTTTVKDEKGNVLSTAVTEAEIKATTDENGTVTTETAAVTTTTDAAGNETVEKTVTTENKTPDGSTGTVVKDEDGNILSQSTTISQQEAEAARDEGRPAQSPLTVAPVPEAAEDSAQSVQVNMPAVLYDKDGDGIVTVAEMPKVEIQVTYSGPGVVAKEKDANGNLTRITECYEGSVIVPVTGTGEIVIVDNTRTFNDVGAADWYSEYVTFVTAREIFNGTGGNSFTPNGTMTRAMLAQVLYNFARGAKAGDGTVFDDVNAGDWFNAAIGWAYENEIVNGYGGSFGAQNSITRQDMATILYRYAKAAGYDVSASASLDKFSDAGDVADYALDAMRWAVGMGLIDGIDGRLDPTGNATRAQVAAIMTRFVRNAK